jgi:hypothetical protein
MKLCESNLLPSIIAILLSSNCRLEESKLLANNMGGQVEIYHKMYKG